MACNYWVSNSVTSFNDSCLPAETTFPSITKAGKLNILYSMIFNKSSSFTKVASLPNSAIACWVVSYKFPLSDSFKMNNIYNRSS